MGGDWGGASNDLSKYLSNEQDARSHARWWTRLTTTVGARGDKPIYSNRMGEWGVRAENGNHIGVLGVCVCVPARAPPTVLCGHVKIFESHRPWRDRPVVALGVWIVPSEGNRSLTPSTVQSYSIMVGVCLPSINSFFDHS